MDVIPEIHARLDAMEKRIDALEDGQEELSQQAKVSGTLASATEHNPGGQTQPGTATQPGVIPENTGAGHTTEPLI